MDTQRIIRAVAALAVASVVSLANKPLPFGSERLFLDSVGKACASQEAPTLALNALESVAEGRPAGLEKWLSAWPGSVGKPDMTLLTNPTVRMYAMNKIAHCPSEDAMRYLATLTPPVLGSDQTGELYPAAAIAYRTAVLERTQGNAAQTAYLETIAQDKGKVPWFGPVRSWAVEQLCDRGSVYSLPVIEKVLKDLAGDQSAEQLGFCESRIHAVAANENRVRALGAVLEVAPNRNERLMMWAFGQLIEMHTDEAERELDRFWQETSGDLKVDEPSRQALLSIRNLMMHHRIARESLRGIQ